MYRKDTLSNGIRVVSETLPKSRSVSIGVWVTVGSRYEPARINGVSHFIEHLFFKGTQNRTAKELATEIDALGGEMNAFTSQETTTYYVKVLDEHLPIVIDLLADIILRSKLDPADLEKERKVILEEIKGVEDTPDDYIHEFFVGTVWRDHPLGRPILGTKESIKSMTHEDIVTYIDHYYSPKEIVISVAGNFEHPALMEMLDAGFGALKRPGIPKEIAAPRFERRVTVKKKQLEQVQVCLGCEGLNFTHQDRYAMMALNVVLGSSMSSRLFQEIREQNALAYSIFSYMSSYRDSGLLTVYAGTDPSNTLEVVKLIVKELKKIKGEGITAAEELRVKNQIKGNLVLSLESSNSHMSRIARQEIYYGRNFTIDEMIHEVERVTKEDVQRLASGLFSTENLSLAILGPLGKTDIPDAVLEI